MKRRAKGGADGAAWKLPDYRDRVRDYCADLTARGHRPATTACYGRVLRRVETIVQTGGDLLAALAHRKPATRSLYLTVAAQFEAWCVERGHRARATLRRVRVRVDDAAPRPIQAEALARLDAEAAAQRTPARVRLLYRVLRETGCRIDEALLLRWADVCLDAGAEAVTFRATKGRRDRNVPLLPGALLTMLRPLRRERDSIGRAEHHVFQGRGGGHGWGDVRWSYRSALDYWHRLTKRARVEATPHQLRHTYATELHRRGFTPHELCRLLGWRKLDTSARYVEVSDPELRAHLSRLRPR